MIHMISLNERFTSAMIGVRYLRTPSPDRASEATVLSWMRRNFYRLLLGAPSSMITRFIQPLLANAESRQAS